MPETSETESANAPIRHFSSGLVVVSRAKPSKVLLIKVKRVEGTYWGLPKGHIGEDESLLEAAFREVSEELALAKRCLVPLCYLGAINYEFLTYAAQKKVLNYKEVHFFLTQAEEKYENLIPAVDEFIVDFAWLDFDEAIQLATYEDYKNILKMAKIAFFNSR